MRILVLTPFYFPDGGPSAPLFKMLCENLVKLGHDVNVIAAVPHYPSGRVEAEYKASWIQRSQENGVGVTRVRVPSIDRSHLPLRFWQFLAYQLGATWAGMSEAYDVLLITNPALEVGIPFAFLSVLRGKLTVFSVHDVYPQVGIQLGIFRHPIVIGTVAAVERFCLVNADYVRVLSESFLPSMRSMGVRDEQLVLIYDWVDTDFIRPLPRRNAFSEEFDLNDNFAILYAGNIGLSQGLEHTLVAAQILSEQTHIQFVFVGDGAGRERLVSQATKLGLKNVKFIPFQPRSRLPEVLATADVALVSLQRGVGTGSLPSKTFSFLASGRPILAAVDEGSDTWNLVQRSDGGICVQPSDPKALASAILTMEGSPELRKRMGEAGRAYAEAHHSPQQAAQRFEALLQRAIHQRQSDKNA